jgi:Double zinc ribbon
MHCPRRGFANPEEMNFCGRCGTALSAGCPHCGFENPPGFGFCGKCGASLTSQPLAPVPASLIPPPQPPLTYTPPHLTDKILAARTALEGEHKQVTVLFADLKGSMESLADRDPEEARQLLDPVLTRRSVSTRRSASCSWRRWLRLCEPSGRRPSAIRYQPVKPSGFLPDSQPDQKPPCGQRMG